MSFRKIVLMTTFFIVFGMLLVFPSWADQIDTINKGSSSTPSFIGLLARLFLSLILIVGLIYVSIYLLKRFSLSSKERSGGSDIEILERIFIAPKKIIYLVKVRSKTLVLGVTDNNINFLTELPELSNEGRKPENTYSNSIDRGKTFSGIVEELKSKFNHLLGKRGKNAI